MVNVPIEDGCLIDYREHVGRVFARRLASARRDNCSYRRVGGRHRRYTTIRRPVSTHTYTHASPASLLFAPIRRLPTGNIRLLPQQLSQQLRRNDGMRPDVMVALGAFGICINVSQISVKLEHLILRNHIKH